MKRSIHPLSRRQMLLAMGTTAGAVFLFGGASLAGLLLLRRERQDAPPARLTVEAIETIPSQATIEAPRMVPREDWGALAPNHEARNESGFYRPDNAQGWRVYEGDLATHYQTVVIHHTAFYMDTDLRTLLEVQRLHRADRGWADIAYHFLVGRTGIIYMGRDWTVRGTHVGGYNTGSLGVALLGNFARQQPTEEQTLSTQRLVTWAAKRLQLTHLAGHSAFNAGTACPGTNLAPYLTQWATLAGLRIGTEGYRPPEPFSTESAALCPCGAALTC